MCYTCVALVHLKLNEESRGKDHSIQFELGRTYLSLSPMGGGGGEGAKVGKIEMGANPPLPHAYLKVRPVKARSESWPRRVQKWREMPSRKVCAGWRGKEARAPPYLDMILSGSKVRFKDSDKGVVYFNSPKCGWLEGALLWIST